MKILFATDFSKTSYNALVWTIQFIEEHPGGSLEIIHCLDSRGSTYIFKESSSLLFQKAEEDMDQLISLIDHIATHTEITTIVTNTFPKQTISDRAKQINADLIAVGTTGLTDLKDLTIGSVTEYLAIHSDIPVLAIPKNSKFDDMKRLVVGIDQERLNNPQSVLAISNVFSNFYPDLFFVQVLNAEKAKMRIKSDIKNLLKNFKIIKDVVIKLDSITKTLHDYAGKVDAQALVLIHHRRNWIGRLFHYSVMKEQLFDIQMPVLIIQD